MERKNRDNGPYIYEKPMKPHKAGKLSSGSILAAGFVYITSQILSPGSPTSILFNPDLGAADAETSSLDSKGQQTVDASNRHALGSIKDVTALPVLGKLIKFDASPKWGTNTAPTSVSNGGQSPSSNVTSPTSASGGGSGTGTAPGNTSSPTSAAGGGSGGGTAPGNTSSPTGASSGGGSGGEIRDAGEGHESEYSDSEGRDD